MSLVVQSEPTSLVEVDGTCSFIEQWAETCESIPELKDAGNRLAAIDEYLSRTSSEGRSRVAAAMRRLEVRIGSLLPRHQGQALPDRDLEVPLDGHTKADFRQMAENPQVVEQVITESTDAKPASRRAVTDRIKASKTGGYAPGDRSQAAIGWRVATAVEMAASGHTSHQIAKTLGIRFDSMPGFRKRHGIEVPADAIAGRRKAIDANRVIEQSAITLEGLVLSLGMLEDADLATIDPALAGQWATSFTSSLRSLNRFHKHLKEMALVHEL